MISGETLLERAEPFFFDDRRVDGSESASDGTGEKRVSVFGIFLEFLIGEREGALRKIDDLRPDLRVHRRRFELEEFVAHVKSGIELALAVELFGEHGGEEMVDNEGIVRVA